ncbi:glycosyltransferase [Shewanella sp. 10N.286.51.B8]|uniref:glycosyltransferase n=1 Tax=Shewanella sp. 10N.286.51.B8 TaxID=3229708 RepID=UPI0035512CDB
MKSKILIVAPFCSLPNEPSFNRFLYIAELLSNSYEVTLLTSNFRHFDKCFRDKELPGNLNYKIQYINEVGYKKNVSLSRLYSHKVFSVNFDKWFQKNNEFDLVYSAFPLIETNLILSKYKSKFGFKLIVDVQDVWPESICSAFPLLDLLPERFLPFTKKANCAYASADALIAVSKTYLDRAASVNSKAAGDVVYIGSDFNIIAKSVPKEKEEDKFILSYIGTLSHSYDVETVILAVNELVTQNYPIEFHIFGCGPFEDKLKSLAGKSVFFNGFINLDELFSFLKSSDVAVNAIKKAAKQSITNKLSDFMSLGIPILNSQTNPEVQEVLNTVCHANYEAGNIQDAKLRIVELYNSRKSLMFRPNTDFDRSIGYQRILNIVEGLLDHD